MADYQKYYTDKCVIRRQDGVQIPFDTTNGDYAEYLSWLANGNTPDPSDPPPSTPPEELQDGSARSDLRDNIVTASNWLGGYNTTTRTWNTAAGNQWDNLLPAQRTTFMRKVLLVLWGLVRNG